jgi:hypothetical protein
MLLFLDFDGVLHPDAVYLRRGRAELRAEGQLFMWAHYLQAVVEETDVQIVLSTSWARHLGYQRARKALPEPVSRLVVGATWHSAMRKAGSDHRTLWDLQTRYEQIQSYLGRLRGPVEWLAVDDDDVGWPEEKRSRLIHTDSNLGLSCADAREQLRERLNLRY